ncbi:hypothetical protein GGR51DRAFT_561338 [Nemania sp. FL0031]|nr:hypothetical protein GGR51DRAFT_561338 [Nemania sp. FL0031]
MPPSRTTRIPPREWETRKDRLNQLYVERGLPLLGQNGVMTTMANEGFIATKSQYETQFRSWGWRKNMSRPEWEDIIHAREQGEAAGPITLGGRVLSDTRSRTALRRYRRQIFPVGQLALHDSADVVQGSRTPIAGVDTAAENVAPEIALPITSSNESTSNRLSAGHSN